MLSVDRDRLPKESVKPDYTAIVRDCTTIVCGNPTCGEEVSPPMATKVFKCLYCGAWLVLTPPGMPAVVADDEVAKAA